MEILKRTLKIYTKFIVTLAVLRLVIKEIYNVVLCKHFNVLKCKLFNLFNLFNRFLKCKLFNRVKCLYWNFSVEKKNKSFLITSSSLLQKILRSYGLLKISFGITKRNDVLKIFLLLFKSKKIIR